MKKIKAATDAPTAALGAPGLDQNAGYVFEEFHPALKGIQGMRIYEEMSANSATISAALYAIEGFLRRVEWCVEPAIKGDPAAEAEAEFVESCMEDMDVPWSDMISDALSMLQYGFCLSEIVYKYRKGPNTNVGRFKSKFNDGRLGWRNISMRKQTTIAKWEIDKDTGEILGAYQNIPNGPNQVYIPMSRALLFRTRPYANNPEGRSILRGAYRSWHFAKRLEEVEAIGVVRSLANLPKIELPPRLLSPNANADEVAIRNQFKQMGALLAKDQLSYVLMPAEEDENGRKTGYKFSLLGASGQQMSTDPVIRRYDARMLMSLSAEFLIVGLGSTGSFAMAAEKSSNFRSSIERFSDIIQDQLNIAIQRLMQVNGVPPELWPELEHKPVSEIDIKDLGLFLSQAGVGKFITPTFETENELRDRLDFPELTQEEYEEAQERLQELNTNALPADPVGPDGQPVEPDSPPDKEG